MPLTVNVIVAVVDPYVPAAAWVAVILVAPGLITVMIPVLALVEIVAIVGSDEANDQLPVEFEVGAKIVSELDVVALWIYVTSWKAPVVGAAAITVRVIVSLTEP